MASSSFSTALHSELVPALHWGRRAIRTHLWPHCSVTRLHRTSCLWLCLCMDAWTDDRRQERGFKSFSSICEFLRVPPPPERIRHESCQSGSAVWRSADRKGTRSSRCLVCSQQKWITAVITRCFICGAWQTQISGVMLDRWHLLCSPVFDSAFVLPAPFLTSLLHLLFFSHGRPLTFFSSSFRFETFQDLLLKRMSKTISLLSLVLPFYIPSPSFQLVMLVSSSPPDSWGQRRRGNRHITNWDVCFWTFILNCCRWNMTASFTLCLFSSPRWVLNTLGRIEISWTPFMFISN